MHCLICVKKVGDQNIVGKGGKSLKALRRGLISKQNNKSRPRKHDTKVSTA